MKKLIFALSFVFAGSFSLVAQAAPMPGTSTSKLVSPQLGLFRSPLGFSVSAADSGWQHKEGPKDNKYIATLFRAPIAAGKKEAATLTVRVDQLEKEMALDKYIQKWMKEYPKYGFDVLGSKSFTQNKNKGYVLDLMNRGSNRQLRQVVFLKKQKAVILTCRDQKATFNAALKSCNQIIRTFAWAE